jgi:hypothetical protein
MEQLILFAILMLMVLNSGFTVSYVYFCLAWHLVRAQIFSYVQGFELCLVKTCKNGV